MESAAASVVVLVATSDEPAKLEALTLAEANAIPASPKIVKRTFSSVALALGWSYAHAPTMPANLLAMDERPAAPAVFKRAA